MKIIGNVIKSKSDKRTYKAIQLQNQLTCLIVSDEQAEKSSAALSVGVGSLKDPNEAQGLAHYLEHMLFMGTEKYPSENDYANFIAKNSGSTNAYTDQTETNYHFEIASPAFIDALDRFAQFFICPLMSDSSSERQLNAVHSQHSKNLQSDIWRRYQLSKHLSKNGHPYNKFSTGDKSTLSNPNLRKMLLDFYKNTYSSNIMNLVVYGKQSVDLLSDIVFDKFSPIINQNYLRDKMSESPFGDKILRKIVKTVPIKDKKIIQMSWVLKNKQSYYKNSPSRYVGHLIGHQAKGSLLQHLIAEGLASQLEAGGTDYYNCFTRFDVKIILTEKGLNSIHSIIEKTMGYIQMLKKVGPQEWVFKQIQDVSRMKFDFEQTKKGVSYCAGLAKNMHTKPVQQVLAFAYFMQQWQPNIISEYLQQFTIQNLFIFVSGKKFQDQCQLVEPIYQTKYKVEEILNLNKVEGHVSLPQPNHFLPKDLTVLPLGQTTIPIKIFQNERLQAYYKMDHRFALPKALLNIRLYFNGQNTAHQQVCRTLFKEMYNEKIRDLTYMAEVAQLHSNVTFSTFYVDLNISGFRDSLMKFIIPALQQLIDFTPQDQALFENLKQKQIRNYQNHFLNSPYLMAYQLGIQALREGSEVSPLERLQTAKKIKFQHIIDFSKYWKESFYSQILVSGNIQKKSVETVCLQIQKLLSTFQKLSKGSIGNIRAVNIPTTGIYGIEQILKNKQQGNSALIVHFQYEQLQIKTKLLQDLCLAFMKEPAFDYLRTKQQLGYIVMCLPDDNRGMLGLSILVQSNIKTSYELIPYVQKFLHQILKEQIGKLDNQLFEQYKTALLSTKNEKDKDLSVQTLRFWSQITKHTYTFDRKQLQAKKLPDVTLEEFKHFLEMTFYTNPKRLEIHVMAQNSLDKNMQFKKQRIEKGDPYTVFANVGAFKKKMPLYPDYYSHL